MIGRVMKSRVTIFLAGLVIGAVFLRSLLEEVEPDAFGQEVGNILANGSFENDGPGPAGADWVFDGKKMKGKGTIERVADPHQEGAFGLRFQPAAANANAGAEPLGVGQIVPYARIGAKKLTISAHVGAEGGASVVVGVMALRKNGSEVARAAIAGSKWEGSLSPASATLDLNKPRDVANLLVFVVANGGAGSAYVDNIVIAPAGEGRSTQENDQPLSVTIQVDASKVIRPIPRSLFGTNLEWIDNGNGIFDPKTGKFDQTVVKIAREAGITQIRYPGGVFSDHFHWKESVGPRDRRPTKEHFPKGPASKLNLGTDEARDLASQLGADLFMTTNAGTGTAEEAAGWVDYLNRKQNAQVRYWEIGNEIYMKSFDANAPPAFDMGPAKYADRVVEFAAAMRQVDPTIKIGAISAENFTTLPFTDHSDWTKVVLKKAASSIDFVAVHNAYAPLVVDGKGNPRDVYLAMLAAPVHIRKSLTELSTMIDRTSASDAERIKIAVTEWGPFFQVGITAPYLDHPKTLGSALFVASTMKVFLESPKVEWAHFFKLSEPTFMGWIGPRGRSMIPKAPLLAFEIFAKHFGDELIDSKTTSPTFDSPTIGLMPATTKTPWFEVVASKGRDGKVYLVGINKHFTAPVQGTISMEGISPEPTGVVWTLTGSGIDAHTGTELPRVPGVNWATPIEIPPSRRINKGNPSEVTLTQRRIDGIGSRFEYSFPPRSVTSMEMTLPGGEVK
jgi:alpha-N-arabinofuranosidase